MADPKRYFFNALIGGYCDASRAFELYQIRPVLSRDGFNVVSVKMDLQEERFYAIGSATDDLVKAATTLKTMGYQRGVYGALEVLLALRQRADVGGWIQYGEAKRGGFELRPTMKVGSIHPQEHSEVTFLGRDTAKFPPISGYKVGYHVIGPVPPVDWLSDALARWPAAT